MSSSQELQPPLEKLLLHPKEEEEDEETTTDDKKGRRHSPKKIIRKVVGGAGGAEAAEEEEVENGRERLKRHRSEVAGRVWVPDMWGQEGLLKDWADCAAFDATLLSSRIMASRAALMEEAARRRTTSSNVVGNINKNIISNVSASGGLRIHYRC